MDVLLGRELPRGDVVIGTVEVLVELADAKRRLANGENPEQVLEHFSRNLSRKFSHAPSQALKQASQEGNASLISSTRRLFKLKP